MNYIVMLTPFIQDSKRKGKKKKPTDQWGAHAVYV